MVGSMILGRQNRLTSQSYFTANTLNVMTSTLHEIFTTRRKAKTQEEGYAIYEYLLFTGTVLCTLYNNLNKILGGGSYKSFFKVFKIC